MKRVIEFFIRRPIWGNAFIVTTIIFGLFSILTMKRSFFPELDPNLINVTVAYPGASPSEMEEGVTIKIEQAVKGLDGIEEIKSTSSENYTQVAIQAFQDTDMDELLSDVENAVNSINSFPQGAEQPIVIKQKTSGMGSVVAFVGISSKKDNATLTELTDLAAQVERDLLNTKEITQISKMGFPEKEININVREQDMLRYNISISDIARVVGAKNVDLTAGIIRGISQEMNVRSNNRSTRISDIEKIVVRTTSEGNTVTVGDVANVELTYSEAAQEGKFNGKPSISFQIEKTTDQDIAKITGTLHDYEDQFNEKYPDYQFNIFFEFNNMLEDRIDLLSSNGIMGLILVLLFLGLFLNVKLSGWVAFGIPFSFLGMFVIGIAYGMTINMISLFGMILVVGILVDDGIVIAENIYTHFERGKPAYKAALDGTMEVLQPVFTSVMTTIAAFGVLLFIEGLEMMREMAFVVIACLSFSLFEAFIILPGHLGHKNVLAENTKSEYSWLKGTIFLVIGFAVAFAGTRLLPKEGSLTLMLFPLVVMIIGAALMFIGFSKSPMEHKVRKAADKAIRYIRDKWFLTAVENIIGTKRKWFYLSFFFPMAFTVMAFMLLGSGVISFTFFPNIQPDFFSIEAAYMPGDSKSKSEDFVKKATQILLEENQRIIDESGDSLISYYSSNIGVASNLGQAGNHASMVQVFFSGEDSKTPVDTLMSRIVRRLSSIPEGQLAQDTYVGGFNRFGKEIEVGLTSDNEDLLLAARNMFKEELNTMSGVFNVKDNMPPGKNEVYIELLPEAGIYGISESDILAQIRQAFFGQEAQRVIIGTDEVKIWVRYPKEDRNSFLDLENMKIKTAQGLAIPLHELCKFTIGRAPETLKRYNGQRLITVDAESTDPDMVAQINNMITDSILPKVYQAFPSVNSVEMGQVKRMRKTMGSFTVIVPVGIILMFIIIMLHFNSLSQAFLIMLVIPAGVAGAFIGHGLVGIPISLLSIFGIIALVGVLVNDAIVYLDRYNELLREGMDIRSAVLEAARSRFRPILLTSLTTVAGLLPIITEKSMQAQFLIPVAVSIAFGVLFGTIFILTFYPSAILFWNARKRLARRLFHGERITDPRDVEPIVLLDRHNHDIANS